MAVDLQLNVANKPLVAYAIQAAILIGAVTYTLEAIFALQYSYNLPIHKVVIAVLVGLLIAFYSLSTFRGVANRSATRNDVTNYFWLVLILYPFITARSFGLNRAINDAYGSRPLELSTAAQALLIGFPLFLLILVWVHVSARLRGYLRKVPPTHPTLQGKGTTASDSPQVVAPQRSSTSVAVEFLIRAAFFLGIASFGIFGLLFAGFASDSGPNSTAYGLAFSAMLFVLAGLFVALTPTRVLFSSTALAKSIWGLFLVSIILPFVVLAIAL